MNTIHSSSITYFLPSQSPPPSQHCFSQSVLFCFIPTFLILLLFFPTHTSFPSPKNLSLSPLLHTYTFCSLPFRPYPHMPLPTSHSLLSVEFYRSSLFFFSSNIPLFHLPQSWSLLVLVSALPSFVSYWSISSRLFLPFPPDTFQHLCQLISGGPLNPVWSCINTNTVVVGGDIKHTPTRS